MNSPTQPTGEEAEGVFLVGIEISGVTRSEAEYSLEELAQLAVSTSANILGRELIRVRKPEAGTLLGKGQIQNIKHAVEACDADTVILDADPSPVQQHNLEEAWGVKLVARSELILDIFARHARTSEGKLQIELAQYQYRLPRLRGQGVALSRLGAGIGTRGPGEMKLEVDRRSIRSRIHTLEAKIEKLKKTRSTQRARRQDTQIPVVALVGYTNAGKSTLLNALTGADAHVEDKLFATLDPLTRRMTLPSGMEALVIDTVGFIKRLPTQIAAAFRATLEEVLYADLLVQVMDATSSNWESEYDVTRRVLDELGATGTPILTVWNKIDALPEKAEAIFVEGRHRPSIAISALEGEGIERLKTAVEEAVNETRTEVWLRFDYAHYGEIAKLEKIASVQKLSHDSSSTLIRARLPPRLVERYADNRVEAPETELNGG